MPGGQECRASWSSPEQKQHPAGRASIGCSNWARGDVGPSLSPPRPAASTSAALKIVDVGVLPSVPRPIRDRLLALQDKPLAEWKMETDDVPILDYLWRSRHSAAASSRIRNLGRLRRNASSRAPPRRKSWTLNLPSGGDQCRGRDPLFVDQNSGPFIGELYREAGYDSRVHQIPCGGREFDTPLRSHFPSTGADRRAHAGRRGGDTAKALRVLGRNLRRHDFCPDPDALGHNLAPSASSRPSSKFRGLERALRAAVLDPQKLDPGRAGPQVSGDPSPLQPHSGITMNERIETHSRRAAIELVSSTRNKPHYPLCG